MIREYDTDVNTGFVIIGASPIVWRKKATEQVRRFVQWCPRCSSIV